MDVTFSAQSSSYSSLSCFFSISFVLLASPTFCLPAPLNAPCVVVMNGVIYFTTGVNEQMKNEGRFWSLTLSQQPTYCPSSSPPGSSSSMITISWQQLPNIPTPRQNCACCVLAEDTSAPMIVMAGVRVSGTERESQERGRKEKRKAEQAEKRRGQTHGLRAVSSSRF